MTKIKASVDFENLLSGLSTIDRPTTNIDENYDNLDKKQQIYRYNQDTDHRKNLICWVKWIVSCSLVLTFSILFLNNILCINVSDTVLVALLTTTTANILGLAFIILRGLFDK